MTLYPGRTEEITNETKRTLTAIAALLDDNRTLITLADIRGRLRYRSIGAIEYQVNKAERLGLITVVYTRRGMQIALRDEAWLHVKARRAA